MRILHRDAGRTIQGGQIQARMLVDALRQRGIPCGLLAPWADEPIPQFDLTHCHDARSHTWAPRPMVVSRRVGFPVSRGWLSRWKYSRANAFLAVSHYVADELKRAGIPSSRIFVVPDGVPAVRRADRSSGRVLSLSKNGPPIPGTTPVTRLSEDLADCDVFVYWSDMEGLGSAALVAQAAGVPVVARRVGGLPEAVLYGMLCDHLDEIPAAITAAREVEPDVAEVERRFGIERLVQQTVEVYREVLR